MGTNYIYTDSKHNQHAYALSGRRYDDGNITFWLEDDGNFVRDLTYPIKFDRPSYLAGQEVAVRAEDLPGQEFLMRHGFILNQPAGSFTENNHDYLIVSLTNAGKYQASLLPRGFDKDINKFYGAGSLTQQSLAKEDIYYIASADELKSVRSQIDQKVSLYPINQFFESNVTVENFELDHGITLKDLTTPKTVKKARISEIDTFMSM